MREEPHVRQVNQDWSERIKRVQVDVDQDKARALGISSGQIKQALEASISGTPITQFREEDQDIDIVSRLVAAERTDLNNLKDAKIYVRDGKFVPVSQVARLTLASEDGELWRRNRVPTMTVRADIAGRRHPTSPVHCCRGSRPSRRACRSVMASRSAVRRNRARRPNAQCSR
jgi:multidrug efflux pump